MPCEATSISDTTTPTMVSAPPSRRPDSTVGIAAGTSTRVSRCQVVAPMLRAASTSCGSMVWMPAAVDSAAGKKPISDAKAILEGGPSPSQTTNSG